MKKCQQISVPEWATDFLGPGDRNSVTFPRVDSTSDSTDSREMVSSWAGPQETALLSRVNPPNLWHGQFDNCRYTSVPPSDPPRQQAWAHPRGGEVSCSQVQEQHHHLHSWTVSTHIPEEGCHAHKSRRCLVGSSTAYYPPRQ